MSARSIKQQATVCIGRAAIDVGDLTFVRDGRREISPDLPLREGHFTRRASSDDESPFPSALADSEPDAWGKRVIQRAHVKQRQRDPSLAPLTRFDVLPRSMISAASALCALRDGDGQFLRSDAAFRTPQLIELDKIYASTRAVEQGTETEADLKFLQGKATSLGGLRPKCTVLTIAMEHGVSSRALIAIDSPTSKRSSAP